MGEFRASRVVLLSLSENGRVPAVGFPFYEEADQRGALSMQRNPSPPPTCVDSPLQFQVESIGGSSLPLLLQMDQKKMNKTSTALTQERRPHTVKMHFANAGI